MSAVLRAVTIAPLAVALAGSPLLGLYCDDASEAAMACCQGDMANCNQAGKTEDCCKKSPAPGDAAAVLLKASAPLKVDLVAGWVAAAPAMPAPPLPGISLSHLRAFRTLHDPPPSAPAVLRI